jgi:hypothetical protein
MTRFNLLLLRVGQLSYLANEFDRQIRAFDAALAARRGLERKATEKSESITVLRGVVGVTRREGVTVSGPTLLCGEQLLVRCGALPVSIFHENAERVKTQKLLDYEIWVLEEDISRAFVLHTTFRELAAKMKVSDVFEGLRISEADVETDSQEFL